MIKGGEMRKDIQKDSKEWEIFREIWELYQRFAIPEESETYWEDLVKALKDIEIKYDKNPLADYLALGVAKALNEIAKGDK